MPHRSNRELAMLAGLLGIGAAARQSPRTLPGEIQQRASDSRLNSPSRERARLRLQGVTEPGRGIGAGRGLLPSLSGLLGSAYSLGGPTRSAIAEKVGLNPELLDPAAYALRRIPGGTLQGNIGRFRDTPIDAKALEKSRRFFNSSR